MRSPVVCLPFLCLSAVVGCGSMPRNVPVANVAQPEYNRPSGPITPPETLFIGDSITLAWLTPAVLAAHPNWHLAPGPTDAQSLADAPNYTTYDLLNGMPAALRSCPQCIVVAILAGTNDYILSQNQFIEAACPNILPGGGDAEFPPSNQTTCDNIQAMVAAAQYRCKAVVVGTIPPLGPNFTNPQVSQLLDDSAEYIYGDVQSLNYVILNAYGNKGVQGVLPGGGPVVAAVDYHAALANPAGTATDPDGDLYQAAYTDDGVNPNAAGGEVMVQQLENVLQAMGENAQR